MTPLKGLWDQFPTALVWYQFSRVWRNAYLQWQAAGGRVFLYYSFKSFACESDQANLRPQISSDLFIGNQPRAEPWTKSFHIHGAFIPQNSTHIIKCEKWLCLLLLKHEISLRIHKSSLESSSFLHYTQKLDDHLKGWMVLMIRHGNLELIFVPHFPPFSKD